MFVSAKHGLFSAESADQHEQRGLRQMKVGQHRFDYFELEARINEKISHARPGGDGPSSGPHCMFEGSNRGSAHRNDSTPSAQSLVDRGRRLSGNRIGLGMEPVILDTLDANRLKSSQADVQGDLHGLDSTLADAVEDFRSEVEACGGGGDRPTLPGIDCLVALAVGRRIRASNVGGQGNVADAIESGSEIALVRKNSAKADASFANL